MNFEMKEIPRQQSDRVRDRRIERVVELVSPAEILEDLPLGTDREDAVLAHRAEVKSILDRDDDRLLVVVGPCSVHDPEAAIDYAQRLARGPRSCATTSASRCASTSRSRARPPAGRA